MELVIVGVGVVSLFVGYRLGAGVATRRAVNYMLAAFTLYTREKSPDGEGEMLRGVRRLLNTRHPEVALLGRLIGESTKIQAKVGK